MALLQDYNKLFEYTDNIKKIYLDNSVVWPTGISSTPPGPDYSEPFYVENISNENETLSIFKYGSSAPTLTIEYSTNKTTWQTLGTTSGTDLTRTLSPGDKVYLRCNTNAWSNGYYRNTISGISKVGGNIMSLLYGNNFTGEERSFPINSMYNFAYLFNGNYPYWSKLISASELLLPANVLTQGCYQSMFNYCTVLTQSPVLPATTLVRECYGNMFSDCTALTTAPVLPATTLARSCYRAMFSGCTALTSAPELPAAILTEYCYSSMFGYCTSLSNVTCLATSGINTNNSTFLWLSNVSSTGTFTKAAGVTWPTGVDGIPEGWTVVEV